MKKLAKLAALLLAGVMVLAMLTACGGGSNETEKRVLDSINAANGEHFSNNAELQRKTRAVLSKVDENGKLKIDDLPGSREMPHIERDEDGIGFVMYVVDSDIVIEPDAKTVTAIEVTDMAWLEVIDLSVLVNGADIEAIGVATFTADNGKTYIGMAVKAAFLD